MVVLVLLGLGYPAEATTSCKDCSAQCNSTCSAANFAGAGTCRTDCSPAPACLGCLGSLPIYQAKCIVGCSSACKVQRGASYDCESFCKDYCSDRSGLCSSVCAESPACRACKENYSGGCKSCCTSYCKCHCV
ncbi:unnamed protein product [Triticum turgidum subsp. durum]|nr:unnamed protein product [Triticum turgidum subsp. durum]